MEVIAEFNGLHGAVVTRKDIQSMIDRAKLQDQVHLVRRLEGVLANNDYEEMTFDITSPAIEIPNKMLLQDLDHQDCHDDEPTGLSKGISPTEIYDMIAQKVIDVLEKPLDFTIGWGSSEAHDGGYLVAYNFDSQKPYKGANAFMLNSFKIYNPAAPLLKNPYYLTFAQIEKRNGKIRKGSHAQRVIYFTTLYQVLDPVKNLDFSSYDLAKAKEYATNHGFPHELIAQIPILKYYNVFNGHDIEGIDFDLANFKGRGYVKPSVKVDEQLQPVPVAEAIIAAYPSPAPALKLGGDEAYYTRKDDYVQMPKLGQFKYIQAYYTTLFHEFIHSTGHKTRLDRVMGKEFGDKDYSFEELVAELGASFLSAEAGMLHYTFRNSAAYIKGWRKRLLELVRDDNRFFFRAASQAQKAADFMLDRNAEGVPAYEKIYKAEAPQILQKKTKKQTIKKVLPVKEAKPEDKKPVKQLPAPRQRQRSNKNSKQLSLLGTRKKDPGLRQPGVIETMPPATPSAMEPAVRIAAKNIVPGSIADRRNRPKARHEYYKIPNPDIGKFLGEIEKKQKESVVITLAGGQGSMKTRMLFQLMNTFAQNYKCGHASIEEHPESALYEAKVDQYLDTRAQGNISAPEISTIAQLDQLISDNEVVFIDSFAKLQKMQPAFRSMRIFAKNTMESFSLSSSS